MAHVLIGKKLLIQDEQGILKLSEKSWDFLKQKKRLKVKIPVVSQEKSVSKKRITPGSQDSDLDETLWETLRSWRKQKADKANLPPYVIFGDATLIEICKQKPASEKELLAINGVGQKKLQRYGKELLEMIVG